MNRFLFPAAFALGLALVAWVGAGFVGTSGLALVMTAVIAVVYTLGALELRQYRSATRALQAALDDIPQPLATLKDWLAHVPTSLQHAVRLRIEGERVALPGPALTPYLVGLLVMLGMLGTFLGMVLTFKGAVFALEGSTDLQAIRTALAAPIKGLGLAFGTSVAGVATSAMLGLMSALSRRERQTTARLLDHRIADVLRPFSSAFQREESLKALQQQARSLPDVAVQLQSMMAQMAQQHQALNTRLTDQQAQFHRDTHLAYTELARAVGTSLQDSLVASTRMAGDTIRPVVDSAMAHLAQAAQAQHAQLSQTVQAQLSGLGTDFSHTAHTVATGWASALQQHERTSDALVTGLGQALAAFTTRFEEHSQALLVSVNTSATRSHTAHAEAEQQRLASWTNSLSAMATGLQAEWQQVSAQTLQQQAALRQSLEASTARITDQALAQNSQTLTDTRQLLERADALLNARMDSDAAWTARQDARLDQLSALWQSQLGALRNDEAQRGEAAVARLGALQTALASQLATLGTALEDPMTRLMQTASDAPRAAAELIAQLRQEMTRLIERDNLALQGRADLMERINALLSATDSTSRAQREAIESLVTSAAGVLNQTGSQFHQMLATQTDSARDMATHVSGSAIELASLGESFHHAVKLFNEANDRMIASLQRIEGAAHQATARSDEQLAYYVAQAREVIDLSLSSQKSVVEDLRRLHSQREANAEAAL